MLLHQNRIPRNVVAHDVTHKKEDNGDARQ